MPGHRAVVTVARPPGAAIAELVRGLLNGGRARG
jgi:hypothetical protein